MQVHLYKGTSPPRGNRVSCLRANCCNDLPNVPVVVVAVVLQSQSAAARARGKCLTAFILRGDIKRIGDHHRTSIDHWRIWA